MSWPHAETRVDEELVRYLLRTQFPAIAEQECWHIGEGFDNFLWRVGDHLVNISDVRRQPGDASSYVRLGRTLLLTTPEASSDYAKAVKRAQTAYEHAVELALSVVGRAHAQRRHRAHDTVAIYRIACTSLHALHRR